MKRPLLSGFFLLGALAVAGCPIYSHEDDGCYVSDDCAPGYRCDRDTGDCYKATQSSKQCTAPSQCSGPNETCSSKGFCEVGDCAFHGCVTGFVCSKASGIWECSDGTSSAGAGGGAGVGGSVALGGTTAAGAGGTQEGGAAGSAGDSSGASGSGGAAGATAGAGGAEAGAGGT